MIDPAFMADLKTQLAAILAPRIGETLTKTAAEGVLDLVDTVAARHADGMAVPFAVGRIVKHREAPTLIGTVMGRGETDGELHTVHVLWDGRDSSEYYGPRELIDVGAGL